MPLAKTVDAVISFWKYITSLTDNQKVTIFSSTLLIASCWFAFETNDENKRLMAQINLDTKEYAGSNTKVNNDCLTFRIECENRIRLVEEAYRRVDAERRDSEKMNLEAKLKDIEKKLQSAEAHNVQTNKLMQENKELEREKSKL